MSSKRTIENPYAKKGERLGPKPPDPPPISITQEEAERTVQDPKDKESQPYACLDTKATETRNNYTKAINAYNTFAKAQKVPVYAALTAVFLNTYDIKKLLSQFSTFLFSKYAALVGPNYLSSFKVQVERCHPDLKLFDKKYMNKSGNPKWYSEMYFGLLNKGKNRNIADGKALTERPLPVSRDLLNEICLAFIAENNPDSVFMSVLFAIVRQAVGRPNELSYCTWDEMFFNGRHLELFWKQMKTHLESPISMPADRSMMALCPFNALGRYLITYGGSFKLDDPEVKWLFPNLKGLGERAITNKMTKALHALAKKKIVPGLSEAVTAYGIRHGAVDDLIHADPSLGLAVVTSRGAWSLKNEQVTMPNTSGGNWMKYVSFERETLRGGLSLGGHFQTRKCPEAPTIKAFATEHNLEKVENLTSQLFAQHDNELLHSSGYLHPLAQTMMASHMMTLKHYESLAPPGEKNIVADAIITNAYELGISKTELYEWGDKATDRFELSCQKAHELDGVKTTLENAVAAINRQVSSSTELAKIKLQMHDLMELQKIQLKSYEKNNDELKSEVKMIKDEVKALTGIIRGIVGEKVSSLSVNVSCERAELTPTSSPTNNKEAAPLPESELYPNGFDRLMKAGKDLANDVDRTRFNHAQPNLMATNKFAANVLIYDINLAVPKKSPFTFPISSTLKTRLKKVYAKVREFLTEEEKNITSGDIDPANTGEIYAMFSRAQLKMIPALYDQLENEDKSFERPNAMKAQHLQVGTVGTKIEQIDAAVNKRLEKEGKKKARKRKKTSK